MPDSPRHSALDFEPERLAAQQAVRPFYDAVHQLGGVLEIESPDLADDWSSKSCGPDVRRSIVEWIKTSLPHDEAVGCNLGPAFWNRIAQLAALAGELQSASETFEQALGLNIAVQDKAIVLANLLKVQERQGRLEAAAETLAALAEAEGLIAPMVRLEVLRGETSQRSFEFKAKRAVVGRSRDCDIVLDDMRISRRHAEFYWDHGRLWIKDLQSRDGSFVNGQRIDSASLTERDVIEIGGIRLVVKLPELFQEAQSISIFDDDESPSEQDEQTTAVSLPVMPAATPSQGADTAISGSVTPAATPSQGPDTALSGSLTPPLVETGEQEKAEPPRIVDENVQFTIFRPQTVQPGKWYPLLAFAHLAEKGPEAADDELDPLAEVQRQAQQVLGERWDDYRDRTQDSLLAVPRDGELTFVPEAAGVRFNPPRRTFLWQEPVHREEFRLQAGSELTGQTARGRMTVYLGNLVLAELTLAIRVDASSSPVASPPWHSVAARPYRRIFASYSHADLSVVEEIERYSTMLGDEYLRDWKQLRAGQVWNDRLREMIREADVFQLFWSSNSMNSRYVRQEWEYALSLNRPSFVRPTYWEDPLPELPQQDLPPDSLRRLHFQKIPGALTRHQPMPASTAPVPGSILDSPTPLPPSSSPFRERLTPPPMGCPESAPSQMQMPASLPSRETLSARPTSAAPRTKTILIALLTIAVLVFLYFILRVETG